MIKPPWISKEWFLQCPFNYCDHFGNKAVLATVCKICREEFVEGSENEERYNFDKKLLRDLEKDLLRINPKSKSNMERLDIEDEELSLETNLTYKLVESYSDEVGKRMVDLAEVLIDRDEAILRKAFDVFAHSRHYIGAKIYRAFSSRLSEWNSIEDDLSDSKTSALFAYVAIDRNKRALLALAKYRPLSHLKETHLRFAKISIETCKVIQKEFFPDDKLEYAEFGYDDF